MIVRLYHSDNLYIPQLHDIEDDEERTEKGDNGMDAVCFL